MAADAALGDRRPMLFSGTFVTGGSAAGLAVATGGATELGRIGRLLHAVEPPRTPQQMVKLDVRAIEDIIRPCGLAPAKAKGIHGLSRIILDEHGGQVPASITALEALPAVGHKTASVVMVQA